MSITVYGASDDLIEIEGDIRAEFNWIPEDGESRLLAFSDGTILRVSYDDDGIWRLNKVCCGMDTQFSKIEGSAEDDEPDTVWLYGEITWVVFGDRVAIVS